LTGSPRAPFPLILHSRFTLLQLQGLGDTEQFLNRWLIQGVLGQRPFRRGSSFTRSPNLLVRIIRDTHHLATSPELPLRFGLQRSERLTFTTRRRIFAFRLLRRGKTPRRERRGRPPHFSKAPTQRTKHSLRIIPPRPSKTGSDKLSEKLLKLLL
jgi:hypothetical protein